MESITMLVQRRQSCGRSRATRHEAPNLAVFGMDRPEEPLPNSWQDREPVLPAKK